MNTYLESIYKCDATTEKALSLPQKGHLEQDLKKVASNYSCE